MPINRNNTPEWYNTAVCIMKPFFQDFFCVGGRGEDDKKNLNLKGKKAIIEDGNQIK